MSTKIGKNEDLNKDYKAELEVLLNTNGLLGTMRIVVERVEKNLAENKRLKEKIKSLKLERQLREDNSITENNQ